MRKSFLALAVAASILTGCASNGGSQVSYNELQTQGQDLYTQSVEGQYRPSIIEDIEVARTAVNTVFLVAKPAYEQYTSELLKSSDVETYFAAVEAAESEEDKRAVYDALSDEQRKAVDEFVNGEASSEIMANLGEAAKVAIKNIAMFKALDTAGLMKEVGFKEMLAEKDKLSLTMDQVVYLNDTVISAYKNYQVVSAFSKAQ